MVPEGLRLEVVLPRLGRLKPKRDGLQKGNATLRVQIPRDANHRLYSDDAAVLLYVAKLSGPPLDRIDPHIEVAARSVPRDSSRALIGF